MVDSSVNSRDRSVSKDNVMKKLSPNDEDMILVILISIVPLILLLIAVLLLV